MQITYYHSSKEILKLLKYSLSINSGHVHDILNETVFAIYIIDFY